jgi:hypothetical protein
MLNSKKEFRLDFIGIGASKSGTTWIAEVLGKHPEVYYPETRKELWYFNNRLPFDYKTPNPHYGRPYLWYHEFFTNAKVGQVCGEITPSYLSMPNTCEDIYKYNPDVKIFVVLRNPIDRTFSQYLFSQQNGIDSYNTFEEAIKSNPEKFIEESLYAKNIQRFYDIFPKNQVKVLFFDDLKKDKEIFLNELYQFLGVSSFFEEEMNKRVNEGQQVKNKSIGRLIGKVQTLVYSKQLSFLIPIFKKTGIPSIIKRIKKKNMEIRTEKPVIEEATKKQLRELFFSDIEQLEVMTGRDLTSWK